MRACTYVFCDRFGLGPKDNMRLFFFRMDVLLTQHNEHVRIVIDIAPIWITPIRIFNICIGMNPV